MPYGLIDYNTLKNIADTLRDKTHSNANYYPRDLATVIKQLSAKGFTEPVIPSMRNYIVNGQDYTYYNFYNCIGFEFTNNIPENADRFFLIGVEDWDMSPTSVICYNYDSYQNVLIAKNANYIGVLDASSRGISNNNRTNVFNVDGITYEAHLGDVVVNGYNNYLIWSNNILYNYQTQNYETGWGELNVDRYNNTGEPYMISNDLYYRQNGIIYGFGYDDAYEDNQFSIIDMSDLFESRLQKYISKPFSGKFTRYMMNTYASCQMITEAICGPNVVNMSDCYRSCSSLINAVCGNNVVSMNRAYESCYRLITASIGPSVTYAVDAYASCSNIVSVQGNASNLRMGFGTFRYCTNLVDVPDFPELIYGQNMFYSCRSLHNLPSCPNLKYGYNMFAYCQQLTEQEIQGFLNNATSLIDMSSMFSFGDTENGANLLNIVIPEHVESINGLYSGYSIYSKNVEGVIVQDDWIKNVAYCPDTVKSIVNLYANKYQIDTPACGNMVIDMSNAYFGCYSIKEPVCGPNVANMDYAYYGGQNIVNAVCGDNVKSMAWTYSFCTNIVDAVCGDNVTDMLGTYTNCMNLTNAVCGPNVRKMAYTYQSCSNLLEPVCGNLVTNMEYAFNNCANLTYAVCGDNVESINYAYNNCVNVTIAACGNNVKSMSGAYTNCQKLTEAVCGPNVTRMDYAYQRCYNLTEAHIGPNVTYSYCAYMYCSNLVNIVSEGNTAVAFSGANLSNVRSIILGENAVDLSSSFMNAYNITEIILPANVKFLNNSFSNCYNLASDIEIGPYCNNIYRAFYNDSNIQNIFIDGRLFAQTTYTGNVQGAFYRSNYSLNRNIVVANYSGWEKLITYSVLGMSMVLTNTVYEEAMPVNVNGVSYDAVRCAYNTSYNTYLYCME